MSLGLTRLNNFDGVQNLESILIVSKRKSMARQMFTEFPQVPTSKALDEQIMAVFQKFDGVECTQG
jgi:hypothetical protein